jgi:hypothetical protein
VKFRHLPDHNQALSGWSLAYYGGRQWDKFRLQAQSSLEPYVFGGDLN